MNTQKDDPAVFDIALGSRQVLKLAVDGHLRASDLRECFAALERAYLKAQTLGFPYPDGHEEPWLAPNGRMGTIKIVRQKKPLASRMID